MSKRRLTNQDIAEWFKEQPPVFAHALLEAIRAELKGSQEPRPKRPERPPRRKTNAAQDPVAEWVKET